MTEIDFTLEEIEDINFEMEYATKIIEPTTQEKEVTPTTSIQEITPDEGIFALSKVTVEAVTSDIDSNIKSENIKSGVEILGVIGTLGEEMPTINGKVFECGEFTLASNVTNNYTIEHSLGSVPEAAFLWSVNAPFKDEADNNLRYIQGKARFNSTSPSYSVTIAAANGLTASIVGASGHQGRTEWSSTTITFNSSATYPLLAGIRYQWLAIKGEN